MAEFPSSHGSLDAEGGVDGAAEEHQRGDDVTSGAGEDGFDSGEFREWMRERARQRRSDQERSRRSARRSGRSGGSDDDRSSSDRNRGTGGGPPPPEWNGESPTFQDWLIKARLWLATTRTKPKSQGPMILQRLFRTTFPVPEALGEGPTMAWRRKERQKAVGPHGYTRALWGGPRRGAAVSVVKADIPLEARTRRTSQSLFRQVGRRQSGKFKNTMWCSRRSTWDSS